MPRHGDNYWLERMAAGQIGVYNTVPPTYTNGQSVVPQYDANGNAKVTLATRLAGEDITNDVSKVEQRFTFTYITTATTTVVKAAPGFLHRIIVGGGTTGTIGIYNHASTSTNPIMVFDTTNAIQTYEFNVDCTVGITIITSAATKVTAVWR